MSTKQVVLIYIYMGVSVYWPLSGLTLESKGMREIFQKKGKKKKGNKGQNIQKFWQKRTKFENILKGSLMRATIARMKQLEYALPVCRAYLCI